MPYLAKPRKSPFKRQNKPSERRKQRSDIYNSKQWKALRNAYFMANPLCEECLKNGKITAGAHVHHIDSFTNYEDENTRIAVALDWNNLMTLCVDCHEKMHGNVKKGKKES